MIRTRRLVLRAWRRQDFSALAGLLADPLVMADVGGPVGRHGASVRLHEFMHVYAEVGFCKWVVEHEGKIIGYCGVMPGGGDHPLGAHHEIGWRLLPSAWGHGFATEAATAALDHAFRAGKVDEVLAYTSPENQRSQAIIARLGFARDTKRDFSVKKDGTAWHGLVWSLRYATTMQSDPLALPS